MLPTMTEIQKAAKASAPLPARPPEVLRVFKYRLQIVDVPQYVRMPGGAQVLRCDLQHGELNVWALVDERAPKHEVGFQVFGTGHPIDAVTLGPYIGTVFQHEGLLVWHVFGIRS